MQLLSLRNYAFVFILVLVLQSCKDKVKDIEFSNEELNGIECDKVNPKSSIIDFAFGFPKDFKMINDSLFIVLDKAGNGKIAHLFNKSGKHIGSFGTIGQGPGEYISPSKISVDRENRELFIFDFNLNNSGIVHLDSILENKEETARIDYKPFVSKDIPRLDNVINLTDKLFIGFGATDNPRIVYAENGNVKKQYNEYPLLVDEPEHNWSIWNNGACFSVSPDGKYLVVATNIGMAFQILDISGDKIENLSVKAFHKPVYKIAEGAIPLVPCPRRKASMVSGPFVPPTTGFTESWEVRHQTGIKIILYISLTMKET